MSLFSWQANGISGVSTTTKASDKSPLPAEKQPTTSPVCRFVNVKLCGAEPAQGTKGHEATVLLENPQGEYLLTLDQLTQEVSLFQPAIYICITGLVSNETVVPRR